MSSIDIRNTDEFEFDQIIFADSYSNDGQIQSNFIRHIKFDDIEYISISDGVDANLINSKEHALNLIKALNKAIELSWLE